MVVGLIPGLWGCPIIKFIIAMKKKICFLMVKSAEAEKQKDFYKNIIKEMLNRNYA